MAGNASVPLRHHVWALVDSGTIFRPRIILLIVFVLLGVLVWAAFGASPKGSPSAAAAGCSPARPHASGTSTDVLETGDGPRSYRLHVPPSYDGSQAVSLVLGLHGYSSTASEKEFFSGLSPLSENSEGGFIVAYPQAITSPAMPQAHWNAWQLPSPEPDDVAFVAQLIDQLQSQLCIARDRVYAKGASNGAMMAVRLACSLPDRIAAVSTLFGLYYPPMASDDFPNPGETCEGTRPVPILAFHGTADPLLPYGGGEGFWGITYRPIESSLALWAQHNGCTSGPFDVRLSDEARLISYDDCVDDAAVQLYVVEGGGHGWPPLEPDPETGEPPVETGRQTWEFFSQHKLPVAGGNGRFESVLVQGGLPQAVDFAFALDGRTFVAEQQGEVRVIKDGVLLAEPFLTVPANSYIQRGLLGLALDPNFATNGYVYLYYTREHDASDPAGPKTGRLIRVTANGDTALLGSEITLLGTVGGDETHDSCSDFPAGADCLSADGCCHIGGALRFAPDGALFVSTGDGAATGERMLAVQDLNSLAGKLLRIDPATGSGLTDNPFYLGNASANRSKVWALGFREPFRMGIQPGTGLPFVGDVGSVYVEEINIATPGGNFGWPCYEGTVRHGMQQSLLGCQELYASGVPTNHPLYSYSQVPGEGSSIVGGVFYNGATYPPEYRGRFFYGDFIHGKISTLSVDQANGLVDANPLMWLNPADLPTIFRRGPVDFEIGPEGDIYFLTLPMFGGDSELRHLTYAGSVRRPEAEALAQPAAGLVPLTVRFDGSGSSDPDGQALVYSWDFGDGATSSGVTVAHTYGAEGHYAATLTVTNKDGVTDVDTLDIQAGRPPNVIITEPQYGSSFGEGTQVSYSGLAMDAHDGPLPPGSLAWSVILHHCEFGADWVCHWHAYQQSSGNAGNLIMPYQGDAIMYLELQLSATNSRGLTNTENAFIGPDSDGDGLPDFQEALTLGTDRFDPDINDDGVLDSQEDFDGDGCTNIAELGPDPMSGGRRDPGYPWDYFNPTGDGRNRMDDILAVVNRYFVDASQPDYSTAIDRGGRYGPNAWNLLPPDGRIRIDDVLTALHSYMQDCP